MDNIAIKTCQATPQLFLLLFLFYYVNNRPLSYDTSLTVAVIKDKDFYKVFIRKLFTHKEVLQD